MDFINKSALLKKLYCPIKFILMIKKLQKLVNRINKGNNYVYILKKIIFLNNYLTHKILQ